MHIVATDKSSSLLYDVLPDMLPGF